MEIEGFDELDVGCSYMQAFDACSERFFLDEKIKSIDLKNLRTPDYGCFLKTHAFTKNLASVTTDSTLKIYLQTINKNPTYQAGWFGFIVGGVEMLVGGGMNLVGIPGGNFLVTDGMSRMVGETVDQYNKDNKNNSQQNQSNPDVQNPEPKKGAANT